MKYRPACGTGWRYGPEIYGLVYMLALEDKLENMPNNLSGGQQQRVAIARFIKLSLLMNRRKS